MYSRLSACALLLLVAGSSAAEVARSLRTGSKTTNRELLAKLAGTARKGLDVSFARRRAAESAEYEAHDPDKGSMTYQSNDAYEKYEQAQQYFDVLEKMAGYLYGTYGGAMSMYGGYGMYGVYGAYGTYAYGTYGYYEYQGGMYNAAYAAYEKMDTAGYEKADGMYNEAYEKMETAGYEKADGMYNEAYEKMETAGYEKAAKEAEYGADAAYKQAEEGQEEYAYAKMPTKRLS